MELGHYMHGEATFEDVLKRLPLDLFYTDEVQKLFRFGMANPKLGFADEAATSFDSFGQLKRALGSPGEGNVWHHIVEQRLRNVDRFGKKAIHCKDNVVAVPWAVNQKIADYFSSKRWYTRGQTVREWLNSKSFEEQKRIGHKILDMVLTGQPLP